MGGAYPKQNSYIDTDLKRCSFRMKNSMSLKKSYATLSLFKYLFEYI
jgi:hypothetical protein